MMRFLRDLLIALLALCLCAPAFADPAQDEAARMAEGIIACKLAQSGAADVQSWLDGALPDSAGSGSEWYILALSQRGTWDLRACREALLARLQSGSIPSASTRLKLALTLAATGSRDAVISRTLAESAGQQGIMSHIFALHLLNNGVTAPGMTAADTVQTLLSLQLADGGWALSGSVSDPDVTAMTLQALAPHRTEAAVRDAAARALDRLSALQREDGDYASYGVTNPETTAQVLIALAEMGIDGLTDPRFVRSGCTLLDGMAKYRLPDGSFSHRLGGAANEHATMQVLLALTAYQRLQNGQPGLYLLSAPAAEPTPASLPDLGYKPVAAAAIAGLSALAMLALFLTGRRSRKNFLSVAIIAAVLIAFVLVTDFQSADQYYSGQLPPKPDACGTVTLAIRCRNALGQPGTAHLPPDGMILAPTELPIAPGDTVYTILTEAAQAFGIHMESSGGPGMRYVSGIANLYEFTCGDLSGWLYTVNGKSPSAGCDQAPLQPGDTVEWAYTLDMGGDLGLR